MRSKLTIFKANKQKKVNAGVNFIQSDEVFEKRQQWHDCPIVSRFILFIQSDEVLENRFLVETSTSTQQPEINPFKFLRMSWRTGLDSAPIISARKKFSQQHDASCHVKFSHWNLWSSSRRLFWLILCVMLIVSGYDVTKWEIVQGIWIFLQSILWTDVHVVKM